MSIHNFVFLCLATISISACSSDVFLTHNGNMPAPEKVAQLKVGQSQAEVQAILGSPSSVTSFDSNTWIYMSSTIKRVAFCNPEIIDRQLLTIKFNKDGYVTQISDYDKNDGREFAVEETQTETAGQNIGFFRKYFGGVGAYMPVAPSKDGSGL